MAGPGRPVFKTRKAERNQIITSFQILLNPAKRDPYFRRLRNLSNAAIGRTLDYKYDNSSIDCSCEVCATDAKYCATSIPRLGLMNEDGTGNTKHVRQTRAKRRARRIFAARFDMERLQYTKQTSARLSRISKSALQLISMTFSLPLVNGRCEFQLYSI